MRVVDISQFEDSVVIHFETDDTRINAYTLASTLVGFADAAKAANATLNAGSEIEIVVEALGPGSFRARIRTLYSSSKNLFSSQLVVGLAIGVPRTNTHGMSMLLSNPHRACQDPHHR